MESGKNEEERAEEFKMRERSGRKDRRETGGRREVGVCGRII